MGCLGNWEGLCSLPLQKNIKWVWIKKENEISEAWCYWREEKAIVLSGGYLEWFLSEMDVHYKPICPVKLAEVVSVRSCWSSCIWVKVCSTALKCNWCLYDRRYLNWPHVRWQNSLYRLWDGRCAKVIGNPLVPDYSNKGLHVQCWKIWFTEGCLSKGLKVKMANQRKKSPTVCNSLSFSAQSRYMTEKEERGSRQE